MNNTTVLIKDLRQETGAGILDCKQALQAHNGNYEQAAAFLRQKNLQKVVKKAERQTAEGLIIIKANEDTVCLVELDCETDFVALTPDFKMFTHHLADLALTDGALTTVEKLETAVSPVTPNQTIQNAIRTLIGKLGENIKLGNVAQYRATEVTVVHGYVHAGAVSGYGPDEGRLGVLVELGLEDKTAVSNEICQAIAHELALHIAFAAPKYVSIADIPADVLAQEQERLWSEVAAENKPDAIKEKMVAGRLNKFYGQHCLLAQPFLKDDSLTVAEWLARQSKVVGTAVSVTGFVRSEIAA